LFVDYQSVVYPELLEMMLYKEEPEFNIWEIFFSANGKYSMLDLGDRKSSTTIMNTVIEAVTLFFERKEQDIDGVEFFSSREDHGRLLLYERFSRLIAKKMGWELLTGDSRVSSDYISFLVFDHEMLTSP